MARWLTHRADSTANEIYNALAQVATVWSIGQPVDFLVAYKGRLFGIDAKGKRTPKREAQEVFFSVAPGGYATTADEALRLIGAIR